MFAFKTVHGHVSDFRSREADTAAQRHSTNTSQTQISRDPEVKQEHMTVPLHPA